MKKHVIERMADSCCVGRDHKAVMWDAMQMARVLIEDMRAEARKHRAPYPASDADEFVDAYAKSRGIE